MKTKNNSKKFSIRLISFLAALILCFVFNTNIFAATKPTSLTLNTLSTSISIGGIKQLTATLPTNSKNKSITWTSSNNNIAVVDAYGDVTGISAGKAAIKATTSDGKTAACSVNVSEVAVTGITLTASSTTIPANVPQKITASIKPLNSTYQSLNWTSSNPAIATVDNTGVVTGVTAGSAVITTRASNGISKNIAITVIPSQNPERTKTVIISDLHLGPDNRFDENQRDKAVLINFLSQVQTSTDIANLVIDGDLMDQWVMPMNYQVPGSIQKYDDMIVKNNQNVIDAINSIIKQGNVTVTYVPGNHDMLFNASEAERIFPGINQARDAVGLGTYKPTTQIAIEHGHRYDFYSAPDMLSNIKLTGGNSILPPGYFYARILTSSFVEGSPTPSTILPDINTKGLDATQLNYSNYYMFWKNTLTQGPLKESFSSKIINTGIGGFTQTFSVNDIIPSLGSNGKFNVNLYSGIVEDWTARQLLNRVPVPIDINSSIIGPNFGTTLIDQQAQTQYFNHDANIKVVVFGHTHVAKLVPEKNLNGQDVIYANTGTWIDNTGKYPSCTYVTIDNNTASSKITVSLSKFNSDGTSTVLNTDQISSVDTYTAGNFCFDNAIDSSGNIWVANGGNGIPGTAAGDSNVMKLSSSGKVIGTYAAGSFPIGMAIDKAGNVWVENYGNGIAGAAPGNSNVMKLSPDGKLIGTYVAGSYPAGGIAIDKSGNVWITNWGSISGTAGTPGTAPGNSNVTELSPDGKLIGTYVAGSSPGGIAMDKLGNVWVANKGDGTPGLGKTNSNITELSSTGKLIGTFVAGSHPEGLAIDPSGNVWVVNKGNGTIGTGQMDSNVSELSPTGKLIGTYVAGSLPEIVAVDAGGNIWVANGYNRGIATGPSNSSVTELSPSGKVIRTFATGNQPYGIAIDKSGNVWVTNFGDGTAGTALTNSNIQEFRGAATGPQYFPYSGPQWPGAE